MTITRLAALFFAFITFVFLTISILFSVGGLLGIVRWSVVESFIVAYSFLAGSALVTYTFGMAYHYPRQAPQPSWEGKP